MFCGRMVRIYIGSPSGGVYLIGVLYERGFDCSYCEG